MSPTLKLGAEKRFGNKNFSIILVVSVHDNFLLSPAITLWGFR